MGHEEGASAHAPKRVTAPSRHHIWLLPLVSDTAGRLGDTPIG